MYVCMYFCMSGDHVGTEAHHPRASSLAPHGSAIDRGGHAASVDVPLLVCHQRGTCTHIHIYIYK